MGGTGPSRHPPLHASTFRNLTHQLPAFMATRVPFLAAVTLVPAKGRAPVRTVEAEAIIVGSFRGVEGVENKAKVAWECCGAQKGRAGQRSGRVRPDSAIDPGGADGQSQCVFRRPKRALAAIPLSASRPLVNMATAMASTLSNTAFTGKAVRPAQAMRPKVGVDVHRSGEHRAPTCFK